MGGPRWFVGALLGVTLACGKVTRDANPSLADGGAPPMAGSGGSNGGDGGTAAGGAAAGSGGFGLADARGCGCDRQCPVTWTTLQAGPPIVELLVDTSRSLKEPFEGAASKWEALAPVLIEGQARLPDDAFLGLIFFPNIQLPAGEHPGDPDFCLLEQEAVPIAPLSPEQRAKFEQAVEEKTLLGGTPTHPAYAFALERIDAQARAELKSLVMILDGAATYGEQCVGNGLDPVDTTPLLGAIANAAKQGVQTYVIGLGGDHAAFSRMAEAGGTAFAGCTTTDSEYCHYPAERAVDLSLALAMTIDRIVERSACSFEFELPELSAGDYGSFLVAFDRGGELELLDSDAFEIFGEGPLLVLGPDACARHLSDPELTLKLAFTCRIGL